MLKNKYISIPQLAKILGISRISVYKKVKKGEIKAIRIGKNYAIPTGSIKKLSGTPLDSASKKMIEKAVDKTFQEYGEVLKLLGKDD